jgi:hypothetical protein
MHNYTNEIDVNDVISSDIERDQVDMQGYYYFWYVRYLLDVTSATSVARLPPTHHSC